MRQLRFDLCDTPPEAASLRRRVRDFLAEASRDWTPEVRGCSWTGFDREFSREVGRHGWIGMTWPEAYGGHERSAMERYVVLEEMLAAGAPVGAHWIGDRQSGPLLLRVGTEEQRQRFLPGIARGAYAFAIGLSEPDAGSDLASLRARATKVQGGWRLSGTKLWSTNAHLSDFMIALFRTRPADEKDRHAGLSQFLVDLRASGLTVRPIRDVTGGAHFNELVFDDVFLPDDMLVGAEGAGWKQATAELAFERSGPERYLSSFPLLPPAIDALRAREDAAAAIGRLVAHASVLRQMSLAVAGMLDRGESPGPQAALVKDLGADLEQGIPEQVRTLLDPPPYADEQDEVGRLLAYLTQAAPSFSLRGGTREILRGIVAREIGLR